MISSIIAAAFFQRVHRQYNTKVVIRMEYTQLLLSGSIRVF